MQLRQEVLDVQEKHLLEQGMQDESALFANEVIGQEMKQ
jgi:hypothetical protein